MCPQRNVRFRFIQRSFVRIGAGLRMTPSRRDRGDESMKTISCAWSPAIPECGVFGTPKRKHSDDVVAILRESPRRGGKYSRGRTCRDIPPALSASENGGTTLCRQAPASPCCRAPPGLSRGALLPNELAYDSYLRNAVRWPGSSDYVQPNLPRHRGTEAKTGISAIIAPFHATRASTATPPDRRDPGLPEVRRARPAGLRALGSDSISACLAIPRCAASPRRWP